MTDNRTLTASSPVVADVARILGVQHHAIMAGLAHHRSAQESYKSEFDKLLARAVAPQREHEDRIGIDEVLAALVVGMLAALDAVPGAQDAFKSAYKDYLATASGLRAAALMLIQSQQSPAAA